MSQRKAGLAGIEAGWSSSVARLPHKQKVASSNLVPATMMMQETVFLRRSSLRDWEVWSGTLTEEPGT